MSPLHYIPIAIGMAIPLRHDNCALRGPFYAHCHSVALRPVPYVSSGRDLFLDADLHSKLDAYAMTHRDESSKTNGKAMPLVLLKFAFLPSVFICIANFALLKQMFSKVKYFGDIG